ncbi:hypothetical protein FNH54_20860 [Salmonella enterica subsp. enterica]|nr:hypothetical protein [Salmonella enterica subsp. enterica serovar Newport]ECJ5281560.1 hypothetical protein [Salmonella enterica subsp. enterica serovar Typhimurium]ELR8685814.1 hypothetical protein [Salmonella enterica]ECJ1947847.1 hypothetical protein [Salmonella enterica subsp. enterica serovar Newport]ECM5758986.1 hypothetical protein [Salmonella enterica subsp. enterica serovar Newport]
MSNNTEKIDDIEMTRYKALDRRFDLFFATATYTQIIGAILNEFCDSVILKITAIPLFLMAIFSILYVFYLNNYLEPVRWQLNKTSKGEIVASKFSNVEFYLITLGLIIYDIVSIFKIISKGLGND